MMDETPNPHEQPELPNVARQPPPLPLDYGSNYSTPKQTSMVAQARYGFLLWLGGAAIAVGCLMNRLNEIGGQRIVAADLVVVIGLSLWIRIKLKWRGFIPGVLLGFGLTCLVPVGIVAVVCGNWKF